MIDEHAASGQTAIAFCAERGIDNKYFSTRKSQLAKPSAAIGFVAVTTRPTDSQNIQLIAGAVQLRIPTGVSAQWLADVIKALA
ncbi:IS66 family insertion sequence element accessory protein TnpA [Cellvibrio sp.]|uniref:IS66 family insertion sequence element accessory protein TnpA n=1 Tax=Cellvibrio sp. TaxID=1965322 RepID=UPI00374F3DF7